MNKLRLFAAVLTLVSMTVFFTQCEKSEASGENFASDPRYAHPLDPLDSIEIKLVKEILVQKKMFGKDRYFSFINLIEPPKAEVLAYQTGKGFRREALASVYDFPKNLLLEIKIDLNGKSILKVDTMKGMQPVGLLGFKADSIALSQIMPANKEWVAALKKRGISLDSVTYRGNTAGDMGIGPKGNREEIVSATYKNKKYRSLGIGGLTAYVDLTERKVLKIVDDGKGFDEPVNINYFKEDSAVTTIEPTKQIKVEQPEGVTYSIKGHEVTWNNWKFRYGISAREGLIIYQASYLDKGKWRSVMYRGSMPEMVVNYGSPDLKTASNNFFDVGVYRLGQSKARPMVPGSDAPANSTFLSTVVQNDTGKVVPFERAAAVYEENDGPLWRHNEKSVAATNLAVKYFTTIGNYDYAFKWVFKQDGTIDIVTELNGIVHIRGVHRTTDLAGSQDESFQGSYFGTLVKQHVEAVNHQHFFVFRLDMDVDGINNTAGEMNTVALPSGASNPYDNAMITQTIDFKTEKEAQRSINAGSARHWKFMNHDKTDVYGHHSSYMLMPSAGIKPLVNEKASLMSRAGFLKNHVWVTPLNEKEIYPAGDYPASNIKNAGLPTWTDKNRDIVNKDLVVWYVAGVTHIVRPEEWPVMAPHYIKFSLMPYGFFNQNPTVKMPDLKEEKVAIKTKPAKSTELAMNSSIPVCATPAATARNKN
jgi:primary-amine oxidase